MDIKKNLIQEDSKIIEAMKIIDINSAKIAFVINKKNKLLGTVTDGDIRRSFLKGFNKNSSISEIMNKKYHYVNEKQSIDEAICEMKKKSIKCIPILNDNLEIKDFVLLNNFSNKKYLKNPVMIMAGGLGKRLGPITKSCPKPMVKIGEKPMLEILLEKYINIGCSEFYISVNYLKEKIINYFSDGSKWGITINYLIENEPLGTAGSLKLLPNTISLPIIVTNADVITDFNTEKMLSFHKKNNANATIGAIEYQTQIPFGVLNHKGIELVGFEEKPTISHLINAGIYIINPELIQIIQKNQYYDMPDLLKKNKRQGKKIIIYPIYESWIDVGRPETLKQANSDFYKLGHK